jgi:hypothetical protein
MRHYPAILCLWAIGVGAILAQREKLLAKLLLEPTWKPIFGDPTPQPAIRCLNPSRRVIPGAEEARKLYPQSHHIRAASRETLRELEPDDAAYEAAGDRLEYLASVITMDATTDFGGIAWAGEFLLEEHRNVAAQVEKELTPGWPLLEGGAFGGDLDRAKTAREALSAWIPTQRS